MNTLTQPEALALAWRASHAGLGVGRGTVDVPAEQMLVLAGLDRVVSIDACRDMPSPVEAVRRLAEGLVVQVGGQFYARAHPAWRSVSQVVDADVLVAWLRRNHEFGGSVADDVSALDWPAVLRLEPDSVDRVQRRPMAETHLHLGGALPTSTLWSRAMTEAGLPFDGLGPGWPDALTEARGHRDQLARAVARRGSPGSFAEWEEHELPVRDARIEGSWLLGSLGPERLLLCLAYQQAPRTCEPVLARYLQLRNAFHYALLQHRDERGLHHFRRVNGRRNFQFADDARPGDNGTLFRAIRHERARCAQAVEVVLQDAADALPRERAGAMPRLDLELRTSLGSPVHLRAVLEARLVGVGDALRSWSRRHCAGEEVGKIRVPPLRVGFVLHFTKDSPVDETTLNTLRQLLQPDAPLRSFVVGFDAAGDELAGPPRQWVGAFCALRRLHNEQDPSSTPIRLGFTYHVGEDIRDLLTSLRHVHEATTLLCCGPRDRLGHATALFWDPARYFARHRYSWPKRGDHLLDLVWVWDQLRGAEGPERVLATVAEERLRRHISALDLGRLDRAAACLREPFEGTEDPDDSESRALSTLGPGAVRAAGDPIEIDNVSTRWQALVTAARDRVRALLVHRGTVVEVNPSSNLFVGSLSGYADLPYLLDEARDPPGWRSRVRWSINTDDPGIFQTSLRNEFAWAARGLRDLDMPPAEVHEVLERARCAGRESSFLPPWSPRGADLVREANRAARSMRGSG